MKTISTILVSTILFVLFFTSSPAFSQWTQVATPEGAGVTDMVMTDNGNLVVTCASFGFPAGKGGIRVSTNGGTSWTNSFQHYTGRTLAMGQNGYVWASSWDYPTTAEGLYVSTDQGVTWGTYRYLIGASNNIFAIHVIDNNQTIFIGTRNGVMKSTNGGYNFFLANTGMPGNTWVRDLTSSSGGIVFAATTNGLFKSTNGALSWSVISGLAAGDTTVSVTLIDTPTDVDPQLLVTGTNNGRVYTGTSGFYTSVVIATIFDPTVEVGWLGKRAGDILLYCLYPRYGNGMGGVAKSTNGGANFTMINEGLPNPPKVSSMAMNTTIQEVFLALYENESTGAKVYKRTISVGVNQISSEIPKGFNLSQNYPNPFNPSTKIKFALPQSSFVKLVVYDALGKEIETLLSKHLSTGSYEAEWSAGKYTSGVYFYTITTNGFSDTKKMLLVK